MFFRLQTNEKTTLCYSAYSRFDTKMATHKSVGTDVLDGPRIRINLRRGGVFPPANSHNLCRGSPRESAPICLYINGRMISSPTKSAHNRFDSKMATLGISKSQILRVYEQNRYVLFGCAKQHDLRGLNSTPTIKKFWGYRGIFQNPPKSFLNYLLPDISQFIYPKQKND